MVGNEGRKFMTKEDKVKSEYLDVSSNIRQHSTMRFAQLTLFIAITAALLNVYFGRSIPLPTGANLALKIAGLLVVVIFWVMEERVGDFFHHYRRRAVELEKQLGYSQYSETPKRRIVTATNAVRLLFLLIGIFWLLALIFLSSFQWQR
jgi:hypothetical protein